MLKIQTRLISCALLIVIAGQTTARADDPEQEYEEAKGLVNQCVERLRKVFDDQSLFKAINAGAVAKLSTNNLPLVLKGAAYPVFQFKKNPAGVFKPQDLVLGPIFDLRRDYVYIPVQNDKFVEKIVIKDTVPMSENFVMNLKGSRFGERLTAQFKEAGFDNPPEFTVYFDEAATAEHCALAANLKQILTRVAKKTKADKNPKVETASGMRNIKTIPKSDSPHLTLKIR